jgi:hypothetical protein
VIEKALGIAYTKLKNIDVPYEFMRWTSKNIPNRYWVGEYSETPTDTEDGYEEGTLILTGTTREDWMVLMQDREKIKDHFPSIYGSRIATDKGTVVIFYENSFPVPTGEADLKRIQINLKIKAWKGMN